MNGVVAKGFLFSLLLSSAVSQPPEQQPALPFPPLALAQAISQDSRVPDSVLDSVSQGLDSVSNKVLEAKQKARQRADAAADNVGSLQPDQKPRDEKATRALMNPPAGLNDAVVPEPAKFPEDYSPDWPDPQVVRLSPEGGPVAGGTVVKLSGKNFVDVLMCKFGDTVVTKVTKLDNSAILCTAPPMSRKGPVDVFVSRDPPNPIGSGSTPPEPHFYRVGGLKFHYYSCYASGFKPKSALEGSVLTINGYGFTDYPKAKAQAVCRFGHATSRAISVEPGQIKCAVPPGLQLDEKYQPAIALNGRDFSCQAIEEFLVAPSQQVSYNLSSTGCNPPTFPPTAFPMVLLHDILQDAASLQPLQQLLRSHLPGLHVQALSWIEWKEDTVTLSMATQTQRICKQLSQNSSLNQGFHLIGVGQGALLGRAVVEMCPTLPPVHTYMSLHGPQAGVFMPPGDRPLIYKIINGEPQDPYQEGQMSRSSYLQYWKDPTRIAVYRKMPSFLAQLNNEGEVFNESYVCNLKKLNTMIVVGSMDDEVIVPPESTLFGYYGNNSVEQRDKLRDTRLYMNDTIGLKALDGRGSLYEFDSRMYHNCFTTLPDSCSSYFVNTLLPFFVRAAQGAFD